MHPIIHGENYPIFSSQTQPATADKPMSNTDELLSSYDYQLPPEFIAQSPVVPRDSSRLLVVDSPTTYHHAIFRSLGAWLQPGDLLIFNNTKVIPARIYGHKATGAQVEILLLEEKQPLRWLALVKPGKRFTLGSQIEFAPQLKATVIDKDEGTGGRILEFEVKNNQSFWDVLEEVGEIPFPPYVTAKDASPEQYQTVYAEQPGAVAAPTAGLHFTPELLETLREKGINQAYLTLHVGVGTFRPVEAENITQHHMHQEWIDVSESVVEQILATKAQGGRIIAVGTTVVRALEGAASQTPEGQFLAPFRGQVNIFIYPGYKWRVVEGLITNFHLPRSSLMMLLSALVGRERLLELYQEAIKEKYRFYSFGDAMLILP